MGHCNHSLPSSVYHSLHVEHSLSLLLDFLWPQATSLALLYHWMWKPSWSTTVLKNYMLQCPLSLICWTNLWIESVSGMDGAWRIFSPSTISFDLGKYTVITNSTNFMAGSENFLGYGPKSALTLLFGNEVFDGFAYVIHWKFAMVSLIVEPAQWLIQVLYKSFTLAKR